MRRLRLLRKPQEVCLWLEPSARALSLWVLGIRDYGKSAEDINARNLRISRDFVSITNLRIKKEQEKNVGTLLSCVLLDFLPGFVMMPGDRVRECLCQALNLPF